MLFLTTITVLGLMHIVHGSATMKLDLIKFGNIKGYDYNGGHCDDSWFGKTSNCDHKLTVCIDRARSSSSMSSCKYWKKYLNTYHDQDVITFKTGFYTIEFPTWPGSVEVKMEVYDHDEMSGHDYVGYLHGTIFPKLGAGLRRGEISGNQKKRTKALTLSFDYRVYCNSHFYGPSCTTYCFPQDSTISGHYSCARDGTKVCRTGWTGRLCKDSVDECSASPCKHGGTCRDGHLSYTCACATGYTGSVCEENIDECKNNTCQNGATCYDLINAYSCHCPHGYYGDYCESDVDFCKNVTCQNNGTCTDKLTDFKCNCLVGFDGKYCENNIDDCKRITCFNEGKCFDLIDAFECVCKRGYSGRLCEANINDCTDHNCTNDAKCVDGLNNYTCKCVHGFTGPFCEVNIDDCLKDKCENQAECRDLVNSYECICKPGFTGKNCSTNEDDCKGHDCLNGADCLDDVAMYTCSCTQWWEGTRCSEPKLEKGGLKNTIALRGNLKTTDLEKAKDEMLKIIDSRTSLEAISLSLNYTSRLYSDDKKKDVTEITFKVWYNNNQISADLVQHTMKQLTDREIEARLLHKPYHGALHTWTTVDKGRQGSVTGNSASWISSNWYVVLIIIILVIAIAITVAVSIHIRSKYQQKPVRANVFEEKSVSFVNDLYEEKPEPPRLELSGY